MREDGEPSTVFATVRGEGEATRGDADAVLAALDPARAQRYSLEAGPRRIRNRTYLDTADGRLRRKGVRLTHDRGSGAGTLTALRDGDTVSTPLSGPPEWPALADELPEGDVRDLVAGPMWVRAVGPVLRARTVTREVRVRDDDGAVVAGLVWRETTVQEPVRTAPFIRVDVLTTGTGKHAKRIRKALCASGSGSDDGVGRRFRKDSGDLYEELLAEAGLPDRPEPPEFTADTPADVAVALALRAHARSVAANVDGTLGDVDTEYLHDLRVAVRRSRSLLKLAGDVLPSRPVDRHTPTLKWLGDVTGPTRDLDVHLLGFDELTSRLTAAGADDLAPFREHLHRERDAARRALVRALRTRKFTRLLEEWPAALTDVIGDGDPDEGGADEGGTGDDGDPAGGQDTHTDGRDGHGGTGTAGGDAVPDVRTFVRDRLARTAKKVTRKAAAITPESPAEDVHDLRKRCKELRYLLEFARPLCPDAEYAAVLKRLKKLQDILGAFQDGEVQSEALREHAGRMHEAGRAPVGTLLAMGELAGAYAADQQQARRDLTAALRRFLGDDMRARITSLVR
ncbi:CHAD domain-containing protein [Prauserella aidingensis]|uniref:CYTH and CHAD domain-containing protein n=1 Tax=Prauserella aidingensis TaxID=387890 RepID=UPI0020A3EBB1|nr:CHAD domain-containing protein [Prauserella aidingensis]MCP2252129.1 CHAD domain-containing protein [Prauserella aidingensis]